MPHKEVVERGGSSIQAISIALLLRGVLGQNGTDKMIWTKWYTDKMVLDKMVWTKWYGQNGMDKMLQINQQ